VAVGRYQRVTLHQRVESMALFRRKQRARQTHRAQHIRVEREARATKLTAQKAAIETCVMGNKQLAVQTLEKAGRDGIEGGGAAHHGIGDASQLLDKRRNGLLRVDQRTPAGHTLGSHFDDADFGDAMLAGRTACGLEIDKCDRHIDRGVLQKLFRHGDG